MGDLIRVMDNLDLPRPDIRGKENRSIRGDIESLIAKARVEKPDTNNLRYINEEQDPMKWRKLSLYSSNAMTAAEENDLSGLDWSNENFSKSVVLTVDSSFDFPDLYRNESGKIFQGSSTYYFDDKGKAIVTRQFSEIASHVLGEYEQREAYSPSMPIRPLPKIIEGKTASEYSYGYAITQLEGGDYELIGNALAQVKSGAWKPV